MIYAAVIVGAVILFYAWLVLAARFQEEVVEFRVGDWVRISEPAIRIGLNGKIAKVVFTSEEVVKIEIRGETGISYVYGQAKAKRHLTLLEAV